MGSFLYEKQISQWEYEAVDDKRTGKLTTPNPFST